MAKKFYTICPSGANVVILFPRDLGIFILSYSVCLTRLEKLASDKHSSLLQKFVNHDKKSFITLGPVAKVIKAFYGRKLRFFIISLAKF